MNDKAQSKVVARPQPPGSGEAARDPKQSPERTSTDASLGEERHKTDAEVERKRAAIERDADDVVRGARSKADKVLHDARNAADHPQHLRAGETVAEERTRADATVEGERATEDEVLQGERAARREALAELFKLERDKTDLHLLTERTRSDDQMTTRDTFLAMVSHDLRSMLGGIAMTAGLLVKDSASATPLAVRTRAETIQRFTSRMNRLVGDLVDVATIEMGRMIVRPERRDLQRLLQETDDSSVHLAASRGIVFTSEIIGRPRVAPFDHDRILQVLANLITNAIKFTPDKGRIALRVEEQSGMVLFSVHDTGSGIPADKLEAIFEPFAQVKSQDRRGLGLGLYISKCIVEGHGGKLWAESTPGTGTAISFTLPQGEQAG